MVAFVLSLLVGSMIGMILGYVARAQIRRTGEKGAGLALAAIIIGWIGLALLLLAVILYVVLFASILRH